MISFILITYVHLLLSPVLALPPDIPRAPSLLKRDDVTIYARKWQKNCQDRGYSNLEVEAWDSYYQLAKYSQLWKPNGAYQSTADLWFGKDSNTNYNRIMSRPTSFENN